MAVYVNPLMTLHDAQPSAPLSKREQTADDTLESRLGLEARDVPDLESCA